MTHTELPRQHIAEQLSDLRQMRGAMADLISSACGLISQATQAEVPETVRLELMAALSHAEGADKIAQDRMRELYEVPMPPIADQPQHCHLRVAGTQSCPPADRHFPSICELLPTCYWPARYRRRHHQICPEPV